MTVDEQTRSGSLSPPLDSRQSERDPTRHGEATAPGSDVLPRQAATDELEPGTHIGRYMILGRLGAGAMGVVYAAWDPELDRKIALKLLHSRAGASLDNRARLLREAKSLARLSHPNVVAVHDVGTLGDRVFLAMEFVAGRTLTAWLKEEPRRWSEVVDVLRRAGEGLAAAHDAGLVHRDFKPDNVLIADDGRVRVLDFGLARAATEAPDNITADPEALALLASASQSRTPESQREEALVTRTGALVGTPAYMSPEQHLGRAADPRSDQFSFCVALYQALYGVRPFTGQRLSSLAFQIIRGKVEPPPAGAQVPAWLRKVVLRGLSTEPEARYATMRALLADLDRDRRNARRGGGVLAGVGGLALAISLWQGLTPVAEPPCQGARAKLEGVWDPSRSAAIEAAFTRTGLPYAADAFASTRDALDAYTTRWVAAHNEACAATVIRKEKPEKVRDLRIRCLDRRRARLRALTDALLEPTASTLEHVPEAILGLGDLATCEDDEALEAVVPPPDDPARVELVEAKIAEADGLELAGALDAALDRINQAVGDAQALGYDPVLAEALRARARIQQRQTKTALAAGSLLDAIDAAARGRDDRVAALAWIDLVYHTGAHQPDADRLDAYLRAAQERLLRAGDDPLLRANLDLGHAAGLYRLGHYEEASQFVRRAIGPLERDPDASPVRLGQAYNLLGLILDRSHKVGEAREAFHKSLAATERATGRAHPLLAVTLINLAELELADGKLADAERHAHASEALRRAALGDDHPQLLGSYQTLANIAEERGDPAAAEQYYLKALAICRKHPGIDAMYLGGLYNNMGTLAVNQDQLEKARDHYTSALDAVRTRFGPDHPHAWTIEVNLAEISLWLGEPAAALAREEKLLAASTIVRPDDLELAQLHTVLAQTSLTLGRIPAALEHAERAMKLVETPAEGAEVPELQAAIVRATLAQCLAAARRGRAEIERLKMLAAPVLAAAPHQTAARRALAALLSLQTR